MSSMAAVVIVSALIIVASAFGGSVAWPGLTVKGGRSWTGHLGADGQHRRKDRPPDHRRGDAEEGRPWPNRPSTKSCHCVLRTNPVRSVPSRLRRWLGCGITEGNDVTTRTAPLR